MALALAVAMAGAVGAVARYLLDGAVRARTSGPLPFGTLTVNVVGSLLLGLVAGMALHHAAATTTKVVVGTGFCGGLTTWSTASWETVRLAEEGALVPAFVNAVGGLFTSLAVAAIGLAAASTW